MWAERQEADAALAENWTRWLTTFSVQFETNFDGSVITEVTNLIHKQRQKGRQEKVKFFWGLWKLLIAIGWRDLHFLAPFDEVIYYRLNGHIYSVVCSREEER